MKKITITILILLTVVLAGCFYEPVVNENVNQNVNANEVAEINKLVIQIEDWNLYKEVSNSKKNIFYFDVCDDPEMDSFVEELNLGEIYEYKLNDVLTIYYTPNHRNWDFVELKKFINSRNFCGLSMASLLKSYSDKWLWSYGCVGGIEVEESDPHYEEFKKCLIASEAILSFRDN